MAKNRQRNNKTKSERSSEETIISIPVYISDLLPIEKATESLFPYTQDNMIENAKQAIESFNSSVQNHIIEDNRTNSPIKHGISSIEVEDLEFNKDKSILLRVSAYQTNLIDRYYVNSISSDEHHFGSNDKLCCNTYCIILYPKIYKNIMKGKHAAYWHVFLYVDLLKESKIISKLARHIMSKVIKLPIRNVKSEKFLNDIRNTPEFSKVEITLSTYCEGEDSEPDYVRRYTYESKIRTLKTLVFYNVKPEDAISALEDTNSIATNSRRTLRFETPEQRVFSSVQDFRNTLSHSFEDSFNYTVTVSHNDVISKRIFDLDFIKEKIQGLFTRYLIPEAYVD